MAIKGVPRVPSGARERQRLIARFGGPQAIVVAQAPAGYGKTVAMAQWAATTDSDGIWLRVREGTVEPSTLVENLGAELLAVGLLNATNPLRLASDALAGGTDPWLLLRHGLQQLPGNLVLALDGIDRLSQETIIGLIDLVVDVPTVSIRATARQASAASEPAQALRLDVLTIGPAELALTAEEAAAVMSADATSDAVAQIMASGGLPLVAKLAASAYGDDVAVAARPEISIAELLDSFIRVEIAANSWDERFVRFVTVTSIAESVDQQLAAELAWIGKVPSADASNANLSAQEVVGLLDRAEAEGLGLWNERSRQSATFVYTPAIREAFERRLRVTGARLVRDLALATAHWELRQSLPYSALRRAVEFSDWELASQVVRGHWNELLSSHGSQLRELFSGTPLGVLRRQPLIAMLLALVYNASGHHRIRALEYFALAWYGSRTQRERSTPADRTVLRAIETAAFRVSGKFDDALTAAIDGRDVLLTMSVDDRDDLGRVEPTLHNQFGVTLFYAGHTEEALDSFARSTAVGAAKGLKAGIQGMALSAGALAVAGEIDASRVMMTDASTQAWPEGWITGYMGSFYQLAGALRALEDFDPDAAEQHLRSIDPHRATIEHWPLFAHADALVSLMRGEPESARVRLEAEITRQRRRRAVAPQTLARLAHTRSLVDLAAGNPAAAERALAKQQSARSRIDSARISLVRAQPDDALRHLLQSGDSLVGDGLSSRSRGEALALRAGALASLGDIDRAQTAIRDALAFLTDREQGLALALVPTDALDAMILMAETTGVEDAHSLLRRARSRVIIPSARPVPSLTPRELALARALPHSRSTSDLAQILSISPNTVKTQLRGLYRKLDVSSRSEAMAALSVVGLTEKPDDEVSRLRSDPFE